MTISWTAILAPGIVLIALVLILLLPTSGRRTSFRERNPVSPVLRDDDRYWSGGMFYNNPTDPDLFVPKRYGFGWTVNFGHPKGKLVMLGMCLLPLVIIVLSFLVTGGTSTGCHTFGCSPF